MEILDNSDVQCEQHTSTEEQMSNVPSRFIPTIVGDETGMVNKRWLHTTTVATVALQKGDFAQAEHKFRLALSDAEKLGKNSRKVALSTVGMARAMELQGKVDEANTFYETARLIDKQLLSRQTNLKEEFLAIARHFIAKGKYEEIEKIYKELSELLRASVGHTDPMMAKCLQEIGLVYVREAKWKQAEQLFGRAFEILEMTTRTPGQQIAAAHRNNETLCDATQRHEDPEERLSSQLLYRQNEF